ncbi:MAG: ABC transporter substrate binding protein [Elusimicrobia bacterium]|nr:ABC transporter substrate binding protein [Elusimicrobiota bacterium]
MREAFFRRRALLPLAFSLALAGAVPAGAEGPAAVLSSDSEHYRQALEGFTEAWGSSVTVVAPGAPLPAGAWSFVAIGSKAAARRWPEGAVVVSCLSPTVAGDAADAMTHVSLQPDPEVLLARLLPLIPSLKVLRVFWSSESSRDDVESLVKAGEDRGVVVLSEQVSPPSRLPERLRELNGKVDALWLMPDPALVTAESFAVLREYAAAERLPFVAPTEGLAERGATATIAVTFRDMGRAAAASLRARLAGRAEPEIVRAGRVSVTVNAATARAVGLGPKFESADKVLP